MRVLVLQSGAVGREIVKFLEQFRDGGYCFLSLAGSPISDLDGIGNQIAFLFERLDDAKVEGIENLT